MAGSSHNEGGSSDNLCLPHDPQFLRINAGLEHHRGRLYGTDYDSSDGPPAFGNMRGHNAPCAVCYTPTRTTKITIPAKISCPSSWTREYYGYLMAGISTHDTHRGKAPVCVDANSESIPGSAGYSSISLLCFLETTCTGINCPPYSK
jgi:hypothetical protein